jgi:hypothetical protein
MLVPKPRRQMPTSSADKDEHSFTAPAVRLYDRQLRCALGQVVFPRAIRQNKKQVTRGETKQPTFEYP